MSGPINAGGSAPARPPAETSSTELASTDVAKPAEQPQGSAFARVLRAKADTATQQRAEAGLPGGKGQSLKAAREEASNAPLREGGEGRADGVGEERSHRDEGQSAWGAASLTAIAGEPRSFLQNALTPSAVSDGTPAETAVNIATRILEVIEMRLGLQGTAAIHMELSLGALGRLRVEIARGEDGKIRLGFESSSERGAELVRTHGDELRGALEARGASLSEFTVQGPEGPTFRLEPAVAAEDPEPASRRAAETAPLPEAQNREDASRENAEERERRRARPEPETEEDE